MILAFFQAETAAAFDWTQFGVAGGVIFIVIAFLYFLIRALPTYKEIKTQEFTVRTEEARVHGQIGTALMQSANAQSGLATAIESLGGTLNTIAVEQRKVTENLAILQRSTNEETNLLSQTVDGLVERIDTMDETFKENGFYGSNRPKAVTSKRG